MMTYEKEKDGEFIGCPECESSDPRLTNDPCWECTSECSRLEHEICCTKCRWNYQEQEPPCEVCPKNIPVMI